MKRYEKIRNDVKGYEKIEKGKDMKIYEKMRKDKKKARKIKT